jgi:hypothetical protein
VGKWLKDKNERRADGGSERHRYDKIPDVRDGLTREERVVLYVSA